MEKVPGATVRGSIAYWFDAKDRVRVEVTPTAADGVALTTTSRGTLCDSKLELFAVTLSSVKAASPISFCSRHDARSSATVGNKAMFYVVVDPLGDSEQTHKGPPPAWTKELVHIPRVTIGETAMSIDELGPVYASLTKDPDVLLRVVLICDAALTTCRASSFVSPRGPSDAVVFDTTHVAFTYTPTRGKRTRIEVPLDGSAPRSVTDR